MDKYSILEFSKIYKRVLDIETTLKQKILFALTQTYPKNEFSRLIPYLQNKVNHKKYILNSRDRINDIIASNKSQSDKLTKFLNIAYLIDVLNILTEYKQIYKDKLFRSNFYNSIPNFNILKQQVSSLNTLRNAIMHFDIKTYTENKVIWLDTLTYWEKLLDTPNMQPIHAISPIKKLNVEMILRLLTEKYPELYSFSDRLVCDMFDDAALINNWDIRALPKYWTIIRIMYDLKSKRIK